MSVIKKKIVAYTQQFIIADFKLKGKT